MPTSSGGLRGGNYATVYRSSLPSPATHTTARSRSASRSHHPRAPGLTGQATQAPTLQLKIPSSRPLPAGPGPLDRQGRKLEGFTLGGDYSRPRVPTATGLGPSSLRPGPLKADHSSVVSTNLRYSSTSERASGLSKKGARGGEGEGDHRRPSATIGSGLSTRRSSSLANLHISDETSSSTSTAGRGAAHCDSDDRLRRSSSRRRNSQVYDGVTGGASNHGRQSSGSEKGGRKGGGGGGARDASRTASPSTSAGTSLREGGAVREDPSTSRIPSHSSSSSSSMSVSHCGGKGRDRDGGKVGLRNLGNTCFMNSVLQCLSNTQPLLDWCLNDSFTADINTTTSGMKGALVKAFASLLKSLWRESSTESYVSPNTFKTQIQKFSPRFMGYSQQDSQEFLRYLLEGIHEDVNRIKHKPKPVSLDDNRLDNKNDQDKAKEYWNAYLMRDSSHIVDIFVGQLKSELKFTDCGHRSVTFDPFWDLSLPIPKSGLDQSLDNCLRQFMKEEELEAEERPMCTKCKMRRSCTKSFSIQRFPRILVFHLKRFSQERYGRKLNTHIDFPVKGLDLSDYSSEGGQKVTYDLYAVSNHSGGVHSGHYTAMCRNPYTGDWHTFNDTRVSGAKCNQAVSSEAYLLFYELKRS